jgi:cardiolipin synthase
MISSILWWVLAIYIILAAIWIILENRRPQSTYAWLLAFIAFPIIGVVLYLFTGRGWKAFSQEKEITEELVSGKLRDVLTRRSRSREQIVELIRTERPGEVDEDLMGLIAHNPASMLTAYNEVDILQDADQFYPRLLEDLRQARHHIHLQYYIWTDDDFTQQVKDVLIERAQAGVQVRALYDASSRAMMSKDYIAALKEGGVQFYPYLAYNSLRTLHLANYRCHRKITVIDGRIGYLGGMNLDREQMPGVAWPTWRDTQIRIHGASAQALQIAFFTAWDNSKVESLPDKLPYFPDLSGEGLDMMPVQITMSGPDSQWQAIRQLYFHLINSARKHVYIQSPFFIPDETIAEAMRSAALAGVDVRLICTPRGHKYQIPYRAANTYFQEMAEAGVKIYLYNDGYYHAKTVNMDSEICSIGSCNMDIRSYSVNYELNSVIYSRTKSEELAAQFMRDMEKSTRFDLEAYKNSGMWPRFVDSTYRLTSPLL